MVEWSRAFGGVPILLHAADREWVMRDAPAIEYWEGGTRELWDGMTLVRCGGHFAGGAIAHVPHLHDGRGALLTGDVIQVAMDNRHAGFMRSFPNYIRSEEHTSELQSLMRISYAVFCLQKQTPHM